MKKSVFAKLLCLVITAMCGFSSCSDDNNEEFMIWDFVPITINFEIINSNGVDLIAENGQLYSSDISVNYKNKTYDAVWDTSSKSRTYLPTLFGLMYEPAKDGQRARLIFGQLDGGSTDADVLLQLPDGTTHTIHISRHITIKGKDTTVKQKVTIDGFPVDYLNNRESPEMSFAITYDR